MTYQNFYQRISVWGRCEGSTCSEISRWLFFFVLIPLLSLVFASQAHSETSKLWGKDGDSWDPPGPLPDFSFAGYHRGEEPIPTRPEEVDTRDFGVVGDGISDDSAARTTFWNLATQKTQMWPVGFGPDCMNWIGLKTNEKRSEDPDGRWVEPAGPESIEPTDLHAAQLAHRLRTKHPE